MEKLVCRQISTEDLKAFEVFLNKRKIHHLAVDDFQSSNQKYINKLESGHCFAIFSHDVIVSILSVVPWETLPYFTICQLGVIQGLSSKQVMMSLKLLYKEAIMTMLFQKRYSFFYLMKPSHFFDLDKKSKSGQSWLQKHIPILKNYLFTFEFSLNLEEAISYAGIRAIVGTDTIKQPYLLRKGSLKPFAFFEVQKLISEGSSRELVQRWLEESAKLNFS